MKQLVDILIVHAEQVLTMVPISRETGGTDRDILDLGIVRDGAVAIQTGCILDVGSTVDILDVYESNLIIDATESVVAPGFIDAHTHAIFAGSREREFDLRVRGHDYLSLLKEGGGIHATVRATRSASADDLIQLALLRLEQSLSFGVTTIEVKSGYGLDVDNEIKILEVARVIDELHPVRVVPTYLGAHVIPQEYRNNRAGYLELMTEIVIPEVAKRKLALGCDVYLENGAFNYEEAKEVLTSGVRYGLRPKIHAGQFSDKGGPELVARLKGLSADHLEHISDDGLSAMAESGTVAVLLPGAALTLGDAFPNGRRFIDNGVDVAIATDNNPGTSRTENLPLMAALAVMRMGLSVTEGWRAITINAAKAVGLGDRLGAIEPGRNADITVFSIPDYRALFYHFGINHAKLVIANGQIVKGEAVS